jgi:MFS family permease
VFRTKIIFATILLDLIAVILAGTPYMLPVFCKDILHTPSWGYGVLNTADAIGALAMGMLVAHLPPFRRAGRAMLVSVVGFGVCAILFALSKSFALTFVLLMFMGAFDNISVIVRHTLVNVLSPNAMRGRINAVNNIFIGSSNELGGYRAGSMAAWLGPIPSVLLGGIAAVIATGAVAFSFPQVRALGSLKDIPPADGDGKAH